MTFQTDHALERNRRYAWARYYQARADTDQISWWAAELAEWLEALADHLPPAAIELVRLAQSTRTPTDLEHIRRYVTHHTENVA